MRPHGRIQLIKNFHSQVDQLSLVIRWVSIGDTIEVRETFLGFVAMSSGKAEAIADLAIGKLESLGITLEKLRGQVSLLQF